MPDREKVIKGLECCDGYCDDETTGCPYSDELEPFDCQEQLRADAIALLKAQEARVMDVNEVREWVGKQRVDREPICIEMRDGFRAWIVSDEYWDLPIETGLTSDVYGKTWRCWTSRPTEAEREATPWMQTIGL